MIGIHSLRISRRFVRIWQRNWIVYQKTWKISFLPPLLEPIFYLLAFGIGLGSLVGRFSYRGSEVSYVAFIAPALLAVNMMYNAFFENTYGSFVRMYYQKTFDAIVTTPVFLEEVVTGEIVWGATRSVIAAAIMLAVISVFGLVKYPEGFLIIPLSFLGGLAFGSIAIFFTAIVPTIELFNLPMFLFITPMFLFSGTFFPVKNLPLWAQWVAAVFPLTHLVELARAFSLGHMAIDLLWDLAYLIVFSMVFFPLAIVKMRKRLIK